MDRFRNAFQLLDHIEQSRCIGKREKGKHIRHDTQVSDLSIRVDVSTIYQVWENRK